MLITSSVSDGKAPVASKIFLQRRGVSQPAVEFGCGARQDPAAQLQPRQRVLFVQRG